MQALRWHGRGDVRLEEIEPTGPVAAAEVEIEIALCGICGSDLAEYAVGPVAIQDRPHVLTGHRPPVTLGHEFAGVVTAVGDGVRGVEVGDRVAADATLRCGSCHECLTGRYNHCALGGSIGLACDGGFAESARIPQACVVPLPDGVDLAAGALLEPLAVAYHALVRSAVTAGGTAVVIGYGPIGAAVALVARSMGVAVLVVELNPQRGALASQHGHALFTPTGERRDDARAIRGLAGGGANAVIECSGSKVGLESALELTRRGGNIVAVGLSKEPVTVDAARLVLFERGLLGALGYQGDLATVAGMIAAGALDPAPLISKVIPLAEAPAELARMAANPGADLKVLINPTRAAS
ncbi:alcohol dehydrogenase catalytic domain-containing protein [Dactylosporangium sp. CA-233914]|uniref:alcohol dehydrogenase catalytic domain-containing protein n=1 Tax=Dactylosporangium sp. CA-233914 TaxID=3239934 RepID=UPI003D8A6373